MIMQSERGYKRQLEMKRTPIPKRKTLTQSKAAHSRGNRIPIHSLGKQGEKNVCITETVVFVSSAQLLGNHRVVRRPRSRKANAPKGHPRSVAPPFHNHQRRQLRRFFGFFPKKPSTPKQQYNKSHS